MPAAPCSSEKPCFASRYDCASLTLAEVSLALPMEMETWNVLKRNLASQYHHRKPLPAMAYAGLTPPQKFPYARLGDRKITIIGKCMTSEELVMQNAMTSKHTCNKYNVFKGPPENRFTRTNALNEYNVFRLLISRSPL
jgi:hypothetical protein